MRLRFIDLFAGLGGFHVGLEQLGMECVFASELSKELQALYRHNYGLADELVRGISGRSMCTIFRPMTCSALAFPASRSPRQEPRPE
ncbi:DNA cytosine methyltransferase [Hymenobacter humi]|uniref:DNA cytosine methyltransferase n=1 Tax=Hymenobacter humi TaxID=1411620 RepID=A0ABW2U7Y5_9BACT